MTNTSLRHTGTFCSHTLPSRFARSLRSLAHPSHALVSTPSATHEARATARYAGRFVRRSASEVVGYRGSSREPTASTLRGCRLQRCEQVTVGARTGQVARSYRQMVSFNGQKHIHNKASIRPTTNMRRSNRSIGTTDGSLWKNHGRADATGGSEKSICSGGV